MLRVPFRLDSRLNLPRNRTYLLVAFSLIVTLSLAAPVHGADTITSVDWTHNVIFNSWTACAQVHQRPASGLSYAFVFSSYSQSGTLDGSGCFTVTDAHVGSSFGYGSAYTLQVRNSAVTSFAVTSSQTLGGSIVGSNTLGTQLLLPGLAIAGIAALVGVFGAYRWRSRRSA